MTYETYRVLISDALSAESEEMFIAEQGWADWMDEYGGDADRLVSDMRNIYKVAHMTVRDLIEAYGKTQADFSERFCIPKRTVEDWATERRQCPPYTRLMMADLLGLVTVERR